MGETSNGSPIGTESQGEKGSQLDALIKLFLSDADPELVFRIVDAMYEEIIGKYRPLTAKLPKFGEKVSKDLVPLLVTLHTISNTIAKDPAYRTATEEGDALNAERWSKMLKIYQEAGFTRQEAFSLLTQNLAKGEALIQKITDGVGGNTKKTKNTKKD